jgi:UDP-N-acetylmuramate--alanine ligase
MERMSVHLIGIGGSGLSAIARILLERGHKVSGSDRQLNSMTEQLELLGAKIFHGHQAENISGVDLVVRSSAILDDNVEVQAALAAGIPVLKRASFLNQLIAGQSCIAIAGTHGKTTTTAMIAWILVDAGFDPSYIVGGVPANLAINAHAGKGDFFVIEADEYDKTFLCLAPDIGVVTNVEYDHPDCYSTPRDFYQAFVEFADRISSDGYLVACSEDEGSLKIMREVLNKKRVISYGLNPDVSGSYPTYYTNHISILDTGETSLDVFYEGTKLIELFLQVPGRHNILNSLAALAVAQLVGIPATQAGNSLQKYQGTGRRFEVKAVIDGITLIDDYAHHPSEIRATVVAAHERYPESNIWVIWQPHTYSRILTLWDEFSKAFVGAYKLIITDVYAARESAPDDFCIQDLILAIDKIDVEYIPDQSEIAIYLSDQLRRGDVLLILSAGDADKINENLAVMLEKKWKRKRTAHE